MRILLVEDDRDLLEPLTEALDVAGHVVDAITDGDTAQWLLQQKEYDLLILDWMLPGVSGLSLCRQYRQFGRGTPILMLTAKDTVLDKVAGLDAGADDYLVKPVDLMEFTARVRALGRRSSLWRGDTLSLADLTLHLSYLTLERNANTVELASREFQLMEYFMRHPKQVLTHNQIEQAVWAWGEEPESNAVASAVRRLRRRLRPLGIDQWIEAVYGIGYRLRPLTDESQPEAEPCNRSRRNLARWFAGSMGSILVVFAVGVFHLETEDQMRGFDRTLLNKSQTITSAIKYRLHQGRWQTDFNEVPILGGESLPIDSEVYYIRWYDSDGQLIKFVGEIPSEQLTVSPGLVTLANPPGSDAPSSDVSRSGTSRFDAPSSDVSIASRFDASGDRAPRLLRQITLPVFQDETHLGYLQMAVPLEPVQSSLQQLRLFLAVSVPLALGMIGITGWILGGFAMRPIQQAYEQLQRFTADASHELRAPLAAILSNVQIGLIKPTTDPDRHQQRLHKLASITQSMGTLVSHLLLLARHDGPLPAEMLQSVDLVLLLKSLIDRHNTEAFAKELTFQADLPNTPIWLAAEPDLLQQAITNLLSNAIKYTPAGGKVTLRLTQTARHAVIQVEDTGIGIPEADLPKIFDRFYRLDPVRTPERRSGQAGGYGLGLSIVQQIVQAHKGQIHATSTVRQGSCFTIKLPLRSVKATPLKQLT